MARDRKRWLQDAQRTWGDDPWTGDADPLHTAPAPRALSLRPGSAASDALAWEAPSLTTTQDLYSALFHLSGVLQSRLHGPVHVQRLVASLSDAAGQPLDADSHWADLTLEEHAPLAVTFGFAGAVGAQARCLTLSAHYDFAFDMVLAIGDCPPIFCPTTQPHRDRWPVKLQPLLPSLGEPAFDLSLHAFTGFRYEPAVEALIQLRERPPSRDQVRELALILRDEREQVVARESCAVTLYGEQPAHLKVHLGLTPAQMERIQRLSVHIQGVCARHEVLGALDLCP